MGKIGEEVGEIDTGKDKSYSSKLGKKDRQGKIHKENFITEPNLICFSSPKLTAHGHSRLISGILRMTVADRRESFYLLLL